MPKIVDHEDRRVQVLEATWRVIQRGGLESATVREIAREVGYSNGVLAHYFKDKNEILVQAHRMAFNRVYDRVSQKAGSAKGIELLRTMLYEALPFDEERRIEAVIDVSFLGRAQYDAELKAARLESAKAAKEWWTEALTRLRDDGEIQADADVDVISDTIVALIDGVSVDAVIFPEIMTPERQVRIADEFVDRIRTRTVATS